MFSNIIEPRKILIIDDNQAWLDSLAKLNFEVLNAFNKDEFELLRNLREKENSLLVVLVNANIVLKAGNCRTSFLGIELVNDVLVPRFPDLTFYLLSFVSKVVETNQVTDYTEFLKYINQNYYGK